MSQGKKSKSGKKTQNTQSPVTRLFKKLGKNSDSSSSAERQNLLTQKKKKKQAEEKCDCKPFEDTRPQFVDACQDMSRHWKASQQRDACCAPQNEKRDETFSCTSCALTKLLTSDPPKLIFLLAIAFIFVVIVVVLNWFTCKSYPAFDGALMGEERRERRSNGEAMEDEKKPWDASSSRLTNGLSELLGTDNTDGSNMHDVRMDNIDNPSQELSNILDPVKVSEAYSSNNLRDFYRKLLKTDIQIKNLRKGFSNFKRGKSNDFFDSNSLRTKRSLKIIMDAARTRPKAPSLNKRSINNLNIYYPPSFAMKAVRDIDKETKEDPGVMDAIPDSNSAAKEAKEQKMLHEYTQKSNRLEDAKYSHLTIHPKTANRQHEMNHPYSKDFEKVDKILRRLFDKQVRETVPNILETILNGEENGALKQVKKNASRNNVSNEEKTRKEKAHDEATKEPAIQLNNEPLETMRDKANPLREKAQHDMYKQTTTELTLDNDVIDVDNEPQTEANLPEFTNGNFGFMVTVAITSLGPVSSKVRKEPADQKIYYPRPRQLLQHTHDEDKEDDDDDDVDYEEQTKEPWDREKRMIKPRELELETEPMSAPTMKLPKMKNSNWKGPVPLYHDELNYMIKAATKLATKKPSDKKQTEKYAKDTTTPSGYTEYFQDNANDNIDELVQISQAYSDYGVLNSKKETIENDKTPGNTVELMTSDKGHETLEGLKTELDNPQQVPKQLYKLNSEIETKAMKGVLLKKLGFLLNNPVLEVKPNKHEDLLATPLKPSNLSTHKNTNYRYPGETVNIEVVNITEPKELKKHKEGNMYIRHRRSLKCIEPEMSNDDVLAAGDNNVEPNVINTVKLEDLKYKQIKRNISEETDNNTTASVDFKEIVPRLNNDTLKNKTTSFGLGEMFGMVADLCMLLAGFDSNQEEKDYKFLYNLVTILNPNALKTKNKVLQDTLNNDTKSPLNYMLDSEMLQNIGHRSRVLLSFEEKVDNVTAVNEQEKEESSEPSVDTNKKHLETSTENNKNHNSSITEKSNALDAAENRTVVKRSAIGNFISWNDLYDDEYGIKDPLENEMKDKSSVKYNDLLAKSENWIGAKFKQIASNMKERKNHWRQTGKKNQHFTDAIRTKDKNISKRAVNNPNKDSSKQTFEALTANMKKIFHEAAEAIHETTSREARSDNEQATTLMQQLVALMSELVDIQVRQKTCVQLPEDLRSFLAWLTTPKTQEHDDISFIIDSTYNTGPTSKNDNFDMMSSNARSDCLGTIHDVQDLIQQYDEMSEEDKSKMSGVREYLEHQLNFLHKQLSSFNEYGFPVYQEHSIRKRRQLQKSLNDKKITHRTTHRFYKYFGRKHTKPTVDEKVFPTEDYGTVKHRKGKGENANENDRHNTNHVKPKIRHFEKNMKDDNVNEKRGLTRKVLNGKKVKKNLHDVYYSALATTNATTVKYNTA